MKEYRTAFRLNDRAPRGAGLYYGPVETLVSAVTRADEIRRNMKHHPDKTGYDAVWVEEREMPEWGPLR